MVQRDQLVQHTKYQYEDCQEIAKANDASASIGFRVSGFSVLGLLRQTMPQLPVSSLITPRVHVGIW